jgi:predicted PurR-regulated permease PerM
VAALPPSSTMPPRHDPPPHESKAKALLRSALEDRLLTFLLVFVTVALGWILWPLFGAILWSAVIALMFAPVQRWLLRRMRRRRTLAALLTLAVATTVVILPLAGVATALAVEAAVLYQRLQSGELNLTRVFRRIYDELPALVTDGLDRFGLTNFDRLQSRLTAALGQASDTIASQAFSLGQGTFEFGTMLLITLYLAFFMIRDGDQMVRRVRHALPLADDHKRLLAAKFATVIRATVRGNLLVALLQGALGGLAFWFLGVGGALLWAVLMAFLSLLPAVGAALVWGPVVVYFLATGEIGKGLALLAWGAGVIGLVDNLLRPLLVGRDTGMSDALVLVTTLGGMAVFGLNGFILGPMIAAMFIAVWHLYAPETGADDV